MIIKKITLLVLLLTVNAFTQTYLFKDNFSTNTLSNWKIYDEKPSYSGPSDWSIKDEHLIQNSNVWAYDGTQEFLYHMGTHVSTGDINWKDYSFNILINTSDDDGLGVLFRYQDEKNYYRFYMLADKNNGGAFRRLQKIVNGELFLLAENKMDSPIPKGLFAVTVQVYGDSIKTYVNSKLEFSVKDSKYTAGKIGMMCYASSGTYFDGVTVTTDRQVYNQPPEIIVRPVRYPYVQLPDTNSVTIVYCTKDKVVGSIKYGQTNNYQNIITEDSASYTHVLKIKGLNAGQKYYYQALTDGKIFADSLYFATVKPVKNKKVSFLVWGDSGTGTVEQFKIAALMEKQVDSVDFALHVGDVNQNNGSEYDEIFFKPYKNIASKIPIYTCIGNHDTYYDNAATYLSTFYYPFNNPANTERYYSFRYGNVFVINLDGNIDYSPSSPQYQFLKTELASKAKLTADWTVVYFHQPPYCEFWDSYDGEPNVRTYLVPVLEANNVDFVFNGHTHSYEHGQLNGVTYIITGGGGGGLDGYGRDWPHISKSIGAYHFTKVDVNGSLATVKAVDITGKVIDSFVVYKNIPSDVKQKQFKFNFSLEQNYPNPFNPATKIIFSLADKAKTNLSIYNSLGQKIKELQNGMLEAGVHEYTFNASEMSSGVYFYKLTSNNSFLIKKMLLVK